MLGAKALLQAHQTHTRYAGQRRKMTQRERSEGVAGVNGVALPGNTDAETIDSGQSLPPCLDEPSVLSSSSVSNTIFFAGMNLDATTGLYYDTDRWYNSSLGTFITTDPAQSTDNLYAYCGNDPIDATDPTGMANTVARGSFEAPPNPCFDSAGNSGMTQAGGGGLTTSHTGSYEAPPPVVLPLIDFAQSNAIAASIDAEQQRIAALQRFYAGLPPIPSAPTQNPNDSYVSADNGQSAEPQMGTFNFQWGDRSEPTYKKVEEVNAFFDRNYEIYSYQHPIMAMGVPRGYTPYSRPGRDEFLREHGDFGAQCGLGRPRFVSPKLPRERPAINGAGTRVFAAK
jgi:RHS repeat-associated protein